MIETEVFFKDIFGNQMINFNCINNGAIKINGYYNENIINKLKQLNEQNREIYFIVNTGGYKNEYITKFNAVFFDLDCGRDENKNYYPMDVVNKYKTSKLAEIHNFNLKPSYIVDTRNGFHVYYLLYPGATIEQFEECEKRLINYFHADCRVKKPANPMRVPNFYWCKDSENKYLSTIIERNNIRYNIEDIISNLTEAVSKVQNDKKEYNNITIYHSAFSTNQQDNNVRFIKEQNVKVLQAIINPEPIEFSSHNEIYEYLKQQDLNLFLGLPNHFNCIFHNERNPSAGIIFNENNGHYVYNCLSSSCGWKGSIIQVTEKITGLNRVKVLRFLREVYKISYEETDWQKEQRAILEENMNFLNSDDFLEYYPESYKLVRNYINILYRINGFAKDFVTTENFTDNEDNAVFFSSISYLANKCEISNIGGFCDRIGLFAFMGLLNKLPDSDLPGFLLSEANKFQKEKKQRERISFFSIPSYTDMVLRFSVDKAKEFNKNHFTMKGFSREMILRALGEEEADRVYPQMKGKKISRLNEQTSQQMEVYCLELIDHQGYTTEREILEHIELYFKGQKNYKETQIKRMIGDMLAKYGLKKQRVNKKLKEKFNIPHDARFTIIYR